MGNPQNLSNLSRSFQHMSIGIKSVKCIRNFVLEIVFEDGITKTVDLGDQVLKLSGPMLEPLKDPKFFSQVKVSDDESTIEWPNGADWAPDVLYQMGTTL